MQRGPVTPKGFRDIEPDLAKKRREVINKIAGVLESFGFVPVETPTLEFAETLLGKYGEEEKLIYQFTDKGGRKLALRYDLTVPLARFVANNLGVLNPSFSRYQIGQVFRGENPQRGRFREFTQLDFDTVGSSDLKEDAKIVAAAIKVVRSLGLTNAKMAINDRVNFEGTPIEVIRAMDKINKIGLEEVKKELITKGFPDYAAKIAETIAKTPSSPNLKTVSEILQKEYSLGENDYYFDASLARGLDYYTGLIFELKPNGQPEELSIGGGGRYDNLIGMFAGRQIPAVGFSFGLDRLIEILNNK